MQIARALKRGSRLHYRHFWRTALCDSSYLPSLEIFFGGLKIANPRSRVNLHVFAIPKIRKCPRVFVSYLAAKNVCTWGNLSDDRRRSKFCHSGGRGRSIAGRQYGGGRHRRNSGNSGDSIQQLSIPDSY